MKIAVTNLKSVAERLEVVAPKAEHAAREVMRQAEILGVEVLRRLPELSAAYRIHGARKTLL